MRAMQFQEQNLSIPLHLKTFQYLKGTKAISSVTIFRPSFLEKLQDNFRAMITINIVIKYANQDSMVNKFRRFHNLVFFGGYLEKKCIGAYMVG